MSNDGSGRDKNERAVQRIVDAILRHAEAAIAKGRTEHDGPLLTVEPYMPPKLRPKVLPSPNELIIQMIAERDAAYARAEQALAHAEKLRLDVDAAARRRQGRVLLQ